MRLLLSLALALDLFFQSNFAFAIYDEDRCASDGSQGGEPPAAVEPAQSERLHLRPAALAGVGSIVIRSPFSGGQQLPEMTLIQTESRNAVISFVPFAGVRQLQMLWLCYST